MRVGLVDEAKHASYFVHVPSIDLEKQVECRLVSGDDEECDERILKLLEKTHDSLWPDVGNRPPWKVAVMLRAADGQKASRADVSYSFHHSIGDGTSGKIFHEQLLQALRRHSSPRQSNSDFVLSFPDSPVLPGPQESIVKLTVSWRFFLSALWEEIRPSFLAPKKVYPWAGAPIQFDRPYVTKIQLIQFDKPTREKLLTVSRMHSTTLTGLLMALILVSVSRQLPEESTFTSNIPISLRPYVRKEAEFNGDKSFHVLVTALRQEFGTDIVQDLPHLLATEGSDQRLEDKVWEIAKLVRSAITERKQNLPRDDVLGLLDWISNMHGYLKTKDGQAREWTWEVSNVGMLRDEGSDSSSTSDKIRIRRMIFSQSASVIGSGFSVSVAGCDGDDNALTLAISFQQGVVSQQMIEGLKRDLEMWMRNLAGTGRLRNEP